jgi:hypothetical protein
MKKKKNALPPPYTAESKDHRSAGTFEVLVPVEGRNKPQKIGGAFPTQHAAEAWLHSAEGKEAVAEVLESAK